MFSTETGLCYLNCSYRKFLKSNAGLICVYTELLALVVLLDWKRLTSFTPDFLSARSFASIATTYEVSSVLCYICTPTWAEISILPLWTFNHQHYCYYYYFHFDLTKAFSQALHNHNLTLLLTESYFHYRTYKLTLKRYAFLFYKELK